VVSSICLCAPTNTQTGAPTATAEPSPTELFFPGRARRTPATLLRVHRSRARLRKQQTAYQQDQKFIGRVLQSIFVSEIRRAALSGWMLSVVAFGSLSRSISSTLPKPSTLSPKQSRWPRISDTTVFALHHAETYTASLHFLTKSRQSHVLCRRSRAICLVSSEAERRRGNDSTGGKQPVK
jgi:hypothetical protein